MKAVDSIVHDAIISAEEGGRPLNRDESQWSCELCEGLYDSCGDVEDGTICTRAPDHTGDHAGCGTIVGHHPIKTWHRDVRCGCLDKSQELKR